MSRTDRARIGYLDGRRMKRLLLGGIARVVSERGHLDRINVFPVPDGDTGTNLTLSLTAIGERLSDADTRHVGELLLLAADAALDGARGNSGAIFAQFLQGFASAFAAQPRVLPAELGRGFAAGEALARSAIEKPQEGTVLSVMREVSETLQAGVLSTAADFVEVIGAALASARAASAATRETMDSLRSAGVEDAGAVGFVMLLEGMAEALKPGMAPPAVASAADDVALRDHVDYSHLGPPEHRFCTECVIKGASIDRAGLKKSLAAIGSSIVVVGGDAKVRIHVHVNVPEQAFAIARRFGTVSGQKADDMARQERSLLGDGRKVAIVSDSGADLPQEIWDDFGIQMVPLRVIFGDRSFLDKAGMTPADFFSELRRNPDPPKTSQPPPGDFRRAYELLSSHFQHVVAISLTGKLSGTYQGAVTAAARTSRPDGVTVVDSCSASVGQGLVVLSAAERARAGGTASEVIAAALSAVQRTRAYGFVPNLKSAVRGGRIPRPWSLFADKLPLSFVLATTIGGGLRVRNVGFGVGDPVRALMRSVRKDLRANVRHRIAIAHADCLEVAQRLETELRSLLPNLESILMTDLGPVIAVHAGAGTVAIAVQEL